MTLTVSVSVNPTGSTGLEPVRCTAVRSVPGNPRWVCNRVLVMAEQKSGGAAVQAKCPKCGVVTEIVLSTGGG